MRLAVIAMLLPMCLPLASCLSTAIGAGAEVGVSASEERGIGGTVHDTEIEAEINAAWFKKDVKMFQDVELRVLEGRVMLTGKIDNTAERDAAVQLAWQQNGVREVIDEIQITTEMGLVDYSRDVRIANTLRAKMLFDRDIMSINYDVVVDNGVIYLLGIAQSKDEIDRVIAYARAIDGVRRVANHIILKTDPSRSSS
jgi:osmotically-inducible protein OsmY